MGSLKEDADSRLQELKEDIEARKSEAATFEDDQTHELTAF